MKKLSTVLFFAALTCAGQRVYDLPNKALLASNDLFSISQGGAGSRNLSFGQLANNTAQANDKPIWNVRTFGANNGGSVDAWTGVEAAAAGLRGSGGTLLFPDGTYLLTNVVNIQGRTITGPWANNTGNIHVKGTRLAKISFTGATNAIEVVNGARFVSISDLHLVGTNSWRLASPTNDGILLHGPSGVTTLDDVSVQNFRTGIYLHDMTGVYARNIVAWSNFVGTATGYKPDGVEIQGRWDRNVYGVFMHMTNGNQHTFYLNDFKTVADHGNPKFSGVFGYNDVGLLIPRGIVHVTDAYFEGNGTSIQLGLNSANAYENTYNTTAGSAPVLWLENFDANAANHLRAYRASTIYARGCRWLGSEVRLMNAAADGSTVDSDTAVVVRKSDNSTVTVNNNYRYVAGVLVPRSGMSWTNLTDITVGSGLSYSGGTLSASGGSSFWSYNSGTLTWTNHATIQNGAFGVYWKLDETSGTRRDSIGTNDLYESNGALGYNPGKVGNAVTNASAEDKWLSAHDSPALRYPSGPWHFGGWFNCFFNDGNQVSLAHKTNEFRIYFTGNTQNRIRVQFGDADLLIAESAGVGTAALVFVQAWWDGTTLYGSRNNGTIYSTNLNTSAAAINPPTPGTGGFGLLRKYSTSNSASADEVFFTHRVLSSGERAALYNSGSGAALASQPLTTIGDLAARNAGLGIIAANEYRVPTNAAPTATTVGTTPPDRWFKFSDGAGQTWYVPAWTNH